MEALEIFKLIHMLMETISPRIQTVQLMKEVTLAACTAALGKRLILLLRRLISCAWKILRIV